jgi:hypothetical protein
MELSLKHIQNKREKSHSDATKDTNEHLDISVKKAQQMGNVSENEGGEEGKLGLEICDKKKRMQELNNPSSVMVDELKEDMKEFYDSKCGPKRCVEFRRY